MPDRNRLSPVIPSLGINVRLKRNLHLKGLGSLGI